MGPGRGWANDVNARATPTTSTTELGFAPWGNAGPGGNYPAAGTHGSPDQFMAAIQWFWGKTR